MKAGDPRVWLGILSAFAVAGVVVKDVGRSSPGTLTAVHEGHPDLAGARNCDLCHGGWGQTMAEACIDCHAAVGGDLEERRGLHGSLEPALGQQCALCHSEHHGADFRVVNARSFHLAGVQKLDEFRHELVGWEMDGAHLELACIDCHEHARADVLPAGGQRYMGLDQDCASCHEDPHGGRMRRACADCHGQEAFDVLAPFEHDPAFPLAGAHGAASCADCHAAEGAHAVEVLAGAGRKPRARACEDCHASPHRRGFVAAVAALAGTKPGASCASCHDALYAMFGGAGARIDAEQHARSGFPLAGPHAELACADCHAGEGSFAERHPGRLADDCRACHGDPHAGQFDVGSERADCLACHERERFLPHHFDLEDHARAAMPLDGAHLEAACESCHIAPVAAPRTFRGTPDACEGCHSDAHEGFFAPLEAFLDPAPGGRCARCHSTASFSRVPAAAFDHRRWTGFELAGAHRQNGCASCHQRTPELDAHGRGFGRVAERFGAVEGCASCHQDPHRGGFDAPGLPALVGGRGGCARCHVETSFRALEHGFDHRLWTGFPLEGAHAAASCASCHEPAARPDAHGRTWGRAIGNDCASCHEDPHAGQFLAGGRDDCARCHQSSSFQELVFDHDRHSRFPLEGDHRGLACNACHLPRPVQGGEVVHYKPLGTSCVDCHGETRRSLRSIKGGR